jgi:hypothetical protein
VPGDLRRCSGRTGFADRLLYASAAQPVGMRRPDLNCTPPAAIHSVRVNIENYLDYRELVIG